MTTYAEFRLRLERTDRAAPGVAYRVEASGLGGEAQGQFSLPFSATELENFILKVGRTRRGVRRIESPEMELAKTFGGRLFSAVMAGRVGELYRAAFAEARAAGSGLRLTLSLTDTPELAEVPWEFLYDEPAFLSISTWTPVVRYLDLPRPRRALEVQLPLRILGIVGTPWDAETLNTAVEQGRLEDALRPLIDAGAVTLDWLEEVNLLALARKLRPDTYHVLHFIGHGGFDDASGEGAVLFEDSTGRGRLVSGDQLGTVLADKVSLRLVVLNSCEGARTSLDDPFSGVAASLVRREIPAVIGMQFEITDRAAVLFAGEFYSMLAAGRAVDSAVTEARLAIFADQNDVEWGTPVLFMRVADGQLFSIANAPPAQHVDPQTLPPKPAAPAIDPAVLVPAAGAAGERTAAGEPGAQESVAATPDPPRAAAESSVDSPPPAGELGGPAGDKVAGSPSIAGDVEGPGSLGDVRATIVHPVSPDATDTGPVEIRMLYVPGPIEPGTAAPDWVAPAWAGPGKAAPGAAGPDADAPSTGAAEAATGDARPLGRDEEAAGSPGRSSRRGLTVGAGLITVFMLSLGVFLLLFRQPASNGSLAVETGGAAESGHVTANGSDFGAGETVDLTLEGFPAGTATVGSDGTFTAQIAFGEHLTGEVAATGRSSHHQASASYEVTLSTSSPPASATESSPTEPTPTPGGTAADGSQPVCGPSDPTRSILFYAGQGSAHQVYCVDPISKVVIPAFGVGSSRTDDTYPTWSPDRTRIAFARRLPDKPDSDVCVRAANGGVTCLPDPKSEYDDIFPAWSVNDVIAFVRLSRTDGTRAIWTVHPDGSDPTQVYVQPGIRSVTWSPDGATIAFFADFNLGSDLATIQPGDGKPVRLTDETTRARLGLPNAQFRNPAWSPDGTKLLFVLDDGSRSDANDTSIWTLDLATRDTKLISSGHDASGDPVQNGNPVWSPDGTQIAAYHANSQKRSDGFHIWVMDADGSNPADLTIESSMPDTGPDNLDPNWR